MAVSALIPILVRTIKTYGLYLIVSVAILAPLLTPGFILTLDMVFTPSIHLPEDITSSYLFYALLHFVNAVLPADIIQKVLLLAILLMSGAGMHRALAKLQGIPGNNAGWEIYAASIFFMVNPFTYDRFMAGQFAVLLGYALLPWFLLSLYRLWKRPMPTQATRTGLLIAIIGIVSIHTLGLVAILAIAGIAIGAWGTSTQEKVAYIKAACVMGVVSLLVSSYWLIPLLLGQGSTAASIEQFSTQDSQAFATTGHNLFNQIVHIARLQGFWAEAYSLFTLPQHTMPLWGVAILLVWLLVGYGLRILWRNHRRLFTFVTITIVLAAAAALGHPFVWLSDYLPPLAGFREPQKFVGLIALCYSVMIAFAGRALLRQTHEKRELVYACVLCGMLLLPVLTTPTMFWGFNNQLRAAQYPSGWYAVNQHLNRDPDAFAVLYLPWHQYMSYSFSGRIMATPAHTFFDKPIIASDDPELQGATAIYASSSSKAAAAILTDASKRKDLGRRLAKQNIKYIILVKEYDHRKYHYLRQQDNLRVVFDTDTITLYHNHYWRKQ